MVKDGKDMRFVENWIVCLNAAPIGGLYIFDDFLQ